MSQTRKTTLIHSLWITLAPTTPTLIATYGGYKNLIDNQPVTATLCALTAAALIPPAAATQKDPE